MIATKAYEDPLEGSNSTEIYRKYSSPSARAKRIEAICQTTLLTEKEVSKILCTSVGTLRRWRCLGEGPVYIKLAHGPKAGVRYHPLDVEKHVEDGKRFPIRAGNTGGRPCL